MAEFTNIIKSVNIRKAYSQRQAILNEISQNVLSVKELDQKNPKIRTLNRLESKANKLFDKLKLVNRELHKLLLKANPDIDIDESHIAAREFDRKQEFLLFDGIDDYIQLLYSKSIPYPSEVKQVTSSGDLSASLSNLVKSQDKMLKSQDKMFNTLGESMTAVVKPLTSK